MATNKTPWKNGIYVGSLFKSIIYKVTNEKCQAYGTTYLDYPNEVFPMSTNAWKFGDFGPVDDDEVFKAAGGGFKNYNMHMESIFGGNAKGILNAEGTKIYKKFATGDMDTLSWYSEEDVKKFSDAREHNESLKLPYKIQPQNQGKLVWLSGAPGAGKSTTGHYLSKKADFVYYEGDCAMGMMNPFIHPKLEGNPALLSGQQEPIKGYSKDFLKASIESKEVTDKMMVGDFTNIDWSKLNSYYTCLAQDVAFHKARMGGNFVVTQAVTSRKFRDHIKKTLPECIFITLSLTRETQRKRIIERHGSGEQAEQIIKFICGIYDYYEKPEEDEKNTFNVDITENMTVDDVMNKVLGILKNL